MKHDAFTGNNNEFLNHIMKSISNAESIDIIVSFLMESGVKQIIDDLKNTNAKIRILTSKYLNITQPEALYILKSKNINIPMCFFFYSIKNILIYV